MFNIFDIGLIFLFLLFIVSGFKRGVIKEVFSLVGIILVFVLSFTLKEYIGKILCIFLPFVSFEGSLVGVESINIFIYQLISFLILFIALLGVYELVIKISKGIQKIVNMTIVLIIPSKIFGAIVSLVKGYIIIFASLLLLAFPIGNMKMFRESIIIQYILYNTPVLANYASNFTTPLKEIYDMGDKLSKNKISSTEANIKAIDIMLEYKLVDKDTVETLIKLKKLSNIEGIDEVLAKH